MEAKILYQEAFVNVLYLNIDFEYDNIKYTASCKYNNGSNIEDIEVLEYETDYMALDDSCAFKVAKKLFENMNIYKNITL